MSWQVEGEVTGKIVKWEGGGIQRVGRYVHPVEDEREENDVEEEKDVGKKVAACTQAGEAFGLEIAGVEFQWKVGECFEHEEG